MEEAIVVVVIAFAILIAVILSTTKASKRNARKLYIRRGIKRLERFVNKE